MACLQMKCWKKIADSRGFGKQYVPKNEKSKFRLLNVLSFKEVGIYKKGDFSPYIVKRFKTKSHADEFANKFMKEHC